MAVVTFVSHDGEKYEAPLTEGQSLMQIAVNNAVPGIDGERHLVVLRRTGLD